LAGGANFIACPRAQSCLATPLYALRLSIAEPTAGNQLGDSLILADSWKHSDPSQELWGWD